MTHYKYLTAMRMQCAYRKNDLIFLYFNQNYVFKNGQNVQAFLKSKEKCGSKNLSILSMFCTQKEKRLNSSVI
jgi:hypothetical protein